MRHGDSEAKMHPGFLFVFSIQGVHTAVHLVPYIRHVPVH
jgi:hypothetical protein